MKDSVGRASPAKQVAQVKRMKKEKKVDEEEYMDSDVVCDQLYVNSIH